ncbi:MAG TPA: hypothetical protein VFQ61_02160 [Polyangiaceae bacterium]|nr:hypothetical protein [Polyangiaceae bacterium]
MTLPAAPLAFTGTGCSRRLGSSRRATLLGVLVLLGIGVGCRSSKPSQAPEPSKARCALRVQSEPVTNGGLVLHMLVRRLDPKALGVAESYQEAAARVAAEVRDESVVLVRPIIPGQALFIPLEVVKEERLIACFFFTHPGRNWRVELPSPLPPALEIRLGQNEVKQVVSLP